MEVCFIYIVWVADNIYILFDLQGVVDVKGKWGFIKMDVTTNCSDLSRTANIRTK